MPKKRAILHYKWSLSDGHVMQQITQVKSYKGILLAREPKRIWKASNLKDHICPIGKLLENPRKVIKKHRIKAIHIHHATLASKLLHLKKKYGLPMIVGVRGKDATSYPKKKENKQFLEKLFKTADLFLPVCHHLKDQLIKLGCPKKKIRVLYGGVDLSRFKFTPRKFPKDRPVRFLAVGRFVNKKGFEDLIDAFAILQKNHKNTELTLIGEGERLKKYQRKIAKYGLNDQVHIIPWVNYQKIQDAYFEADIFCAPSRTDKDGNQEGIPNTLKEAMATGMPCIATKHAGIPEIMKSKVSGLLVPEQNVNRLAKAMKAIIEHPEKWERYSVNARKKIVKSFNLTKQLAKQKGYYDELLKKG
ncbi:glycosyltransferase [Brevibacillus sp. SYSU BS000544]|uniref:glycosyltransferase n=1 Tax=Brevibacillus sp. SYSU BS000544 TaxID=3416443 RepID=UPI003CE4CABA